MKKVLKVGVYDLLHVGHVNLFHRAKAQGDYLIVAVQGSDVVLKYKPKAKLIYRTKERIYMVKSFRYLDEVIKYNAVDDIVKTIGYDFLATCPDQIHEGFQRAILWCRDHGKEAMRFLVQKVFPHNG